MVGTNSIWNYGCSATNTLAGGEKEFGPFKIKYNPHKPQRKVDTKN